MCEAWAGPQAPAASPGSAAGALSICTAPDAALPPHEHFQHKFSRSHSNCRLSNAFLHSPSPPVILFCPVSCSDPLWNSFPGNRFARFMYKQIMLIVYIVPASR